jgi:hypothetical protein
VFNFSPSLKNCPSARCASAANVVCRDFDLFKTNIVREELRLRVFEDRVLRRIFGPNRDEVTGGWRKLHNEELHGLYSSPSIV